jgi:3-methyladenine DNA glycosylase AlkD
MSHPLILAIKSALAAAANPANAGPMQRYMKSTMPYRGVKTPDQRLIYRELFKRYPILSFEEYIAIIRELWDSAEYREERYTAINLARRYKSFQTLEALPLYRHMIVTGAWWDYVDGIASDLIGELLRKHPTDMKPELRRWIEDPQIWVRRAAILSQLRFKTETDEALLFEFCLKCMDEKEFWTRKAIGWALREYSKTNSEAARRFVEENRTRMSGVTRKEAEKYI